MFEQRNGGVHGQPPQAPSDPHHCPLPAQVGNARFATGRYLEAAFLFRLMVTSTELQVSRGAGAPAATAVPARLLKASRPAPPLPPHA